MPSHMKAAARSITVSLIREAARISSRSVSSLRARASSTQAEASTQRLPGLWAIRGRRKRAGHSLSIPMGLVPSTFSAKMAR